jgi:acylphosphatase
MIKNLHIHVEGSVQHKGFRFTAMQMAYEYKVMGLVSNQRDGSLYIEAEGEEEDLEKFVKWCKKGPMWAKVEKIDVEEGEVKNYKSFDIL